MIIRSILSMQNKETINVYTNICAMKFEVNNERSTFIIWFKAKNNNNQQQP